MTRQLKSHKRPCYMFSGNISQRQSPLKKVWRMSSQSETNLLTRKTKRITFSLWNSKSMTSHSKHAIVHRARTLSRASLRWLAAKSNPRDSSSNSIGSLVRGRDASTFTLKVRANKRLRMLTKKSKGSSRRPLWVTVTWMRATLGSPASLLSTDYLHKSHSCSCSNLQET